MKNIRLLVMLTILIPISTMHAQTLMDYIKEVKSDTLVVKTYEEMGNKPDALYKTLVLDTINVPAGRVYELQAGGWYPLTTNPTTSAKHPTVIVGSDERMVVTNKDASSAPPLISGYTDIITNTGGINAGGDLTIKNCALTPAANDGSLGWVFTTTTASNVKLVLDNCIMERTRWVFAGIYNENCNVTLRNCYFVNLGGQPCRRSGGVFDCFAKMDTLLIENCTHVMTAGTMYRFRAYQFKRIIINHNTFVNCAGSTFMNPGYQSNVSLTNNLFVNCNVQPYPAIRTIDLGEQDLGWQPMGLVNVYPDSANEANNTPRKLLVEKNLLYWDPYLTNVVDTVNQLQVNHTSDWKSQMILMNSQTKSMFNDNAKYPYLTEGTTYTEKPNFTEPKDLFGEQLINLKKHAVAIVDTYGVSLLPDWRLVNTGTDKYIYFDWPIPVDLSYSNSELLTGGMNGLPIGDLNWFPTQKTTWLTQRATEYATIQSMLGNGTLGVEIENTQPFEFTLYQNYPNPFNPSTMIRFSIPKAGNATLKVYNILGEKVETLLDGYTTSGRHEVQFNASNLASGIYFYRLTIGNFTEVKKMMLMK